MLLQKAERRNGIVTIRPTDAKKSGSRGRAQSMTTISPFSDNKKDHHTEPVI